MMRVSAECEFKNETGIYTFEATGRYYPGYNEPPSLDDLEIGPVVRFENDDDGEGKPAVLSPELQEELTEYAVEQLFDAVENARSSE